jgi:hypothetical protein
MQGLVKTFPNGILISATTLRAVRSRLMVNAVSVPADLHRQMGELNVYELLGSEPGPAGTAFTGAGEAAEGLTNPPDHFRVSPHM